MDRQEFHKNFGISPEVTERAQVEADAKAAAQAPKTIGFKLPGDAHERLTRQAKARKTSLKAECARLVLAAERAETLLRAGLESLSPMVREKACKAALAVLSGVDVPQAAPAPQEPATGQPSALLAEVAERAVALRIYNYASSAVDDLRSCRLEHGKQIDFARLLTCSDVAFSHDIGGIRDHLNRVTGSLRGFLPKMHVRP
jgi:hypothetical protein